MIEVDSQQPPLDPAYTCACTPHVHTHIQPQHKTKAVRDVGRHTDMHVSSSAAAYERMILPAEGYEDLEQTCIFCSEICSL